MVVSHFLKANIWKSEFKFEFALPSKWIVPMYAPCYILVCKRIWLPYIVLLELGFLLIGISYEMSEVFYWEKKKINSNFPNRSITIMHTLHKMYILVIAFIHWPIRQSTTVKLHSVFRMIENCIRTHKKTSTHNKFYLFFWIVGQIEKNKRIGGLCVQVRVRV